MQGLPKGRETYGDGVAIVVGERESRLHTSLLVLEKRVTGEVR